MDMSYSMDLTHRWFRAGRDLTPVFSSAQVDPVRPLSAGGEGDGGEVARQALQVRR
jgi:hypothetical protein